MASSAADQPRRFEPWRLRSGGRVDGRRRELFALAAPVFRQHGFRGATIKALAHACGLSPAGLYHYFGSKADMATYLLRQPQMDWDSTWVDPTSDPLEQLRLLVRLSIAALPDYLLALRLAEEARGPTAHGGSPARAFREGEAVFGRLLTAAAPAMSRRDAARLARDVLAAMVGTAVIAIDEEPGAAIEQRVNGIIRAALVPGHVDADRFDGVMHRTE